MKPPVRTVLFASLLSIAVARAQDAAPRLLIGDAEIRAWLSDLIPAVEAAAGETFREPPEVLLSDEREVARALKADLEVQIRSLYPSAGDRAVEALASQQAGGLATSLLGKYGFESRVLYLLPEQLDPHLQLYGIDPRLRADLFELVIAHELVHALQDQVLDLKGRLRRIEDQDRALGLSCLIEGHAVFCTERVGRALGLDAAIPELRRMMTTDPRDASTRAAMAFSIRSQRLAPRTLYQTATEFIEHHHRDGGSARLWDILRAPPPPTRVIFVPERLGAAGPAPRDLSPALERVPELLGSASWTIGGGTAGEMMVRSENAGVAEDWIERVLDPMRGGSFVEMQRGTALLRKTVLALEFADEQAATAFTDLAIAAAHVDRRAIEEDARLRRQAEIAIAPIDAPDGTWAMGYRQQPTSVSAICRGEVIWFRRGRFVVQVTLVGVRRDDEAVARTADAVLERLEGL